MAAFAASFLFVPSMRFGALAGAAIGGVSWMGLTALLGRPHDTLMLMGACGAFVGLWVGGGMNDRVWTIVRQGQGESHG
jgi:hypothetical protein